MLSLLEIQKLQFGDKARAEKELKDFFLANYAEPTSKVAINTKPESLNSLNGIVSFANGEEYFFKTHVEENEQLAEYYNASLLQDAGYPVLRPRKLETAPGQQLVLYEIVTLPTLFDEAKSAEDKALATGGKLDDQAKTLIALNGELDKKVFECHKNTLDKEKKPTPGAPIHQLFGHRLAPDGRIDIFYKNKSTELGEQEISFQQLLNLRWTINGTTYGHTLGELIQRAREQMSIDRPVATAVGHGDAHNGNVFVDYPGQQLLYFDPAFAGRHDPILDLTKPIFHNVFARWMYFPEQVNDEFEIAMLLENDTVDISHSYRPSLLRQAFLETKLKYALHPLLRHLRENGILAPDWQDYLRSALLCCPLLTVNLFAPSNPNGTLSEKYSPKIKLLGLVMAISAGSTASTANKVNKSDNLHQMFTSIFEF